MNITAKITCIKYRISLSGNLKNIDINDFNINESPAYCLVKNGNNSFAVSKPLKIEYTLSKEHLIPLTCKILNQWVKQSKYPLDDLYKITSNINPIRTTNYE